MSTRPLASIWVDHLGLAVSGVIAVIIAARVLAVAHYSPTTALVLISTVGTGQLLVGALVKAFPFGLMVISLVLQSFWVGSRAEDKRLATWGLAGAATLLVVFAPWTVVVVTAALTLLTLTPILRTLLSPSLSTSRREYLAFLLRGSSETDTQPSQGVHVGVFIALLVLWFASTQDAWLPAERLDLPTGVVSGYVLGTQDSEYVVLVAGDRHIMRIPATSVRARAYCRETRQTLWSEMESQPPLFALALGSIKSVRYPACP